MTGMDPARSLWAGANRDAVRFHIAVAVVVGGASGVPMGYAVLSGLVGLVFAVSGGILLRARPLDPGLAARLPRARYPGLVLGVLCLVWSAYHGCLMLEGGLAPYRKVVWALVPVCTVLCYRYLDYLLARALGALLVLCSASLLHGGFAQAVALRPLYSVACYAVGVLGMAFIAVPWRFRDLLAAFSRAVPWRRPTGGLMAVLGGVLVALPFLPRAL